MKIDQEAAIEFSVKDVVSERPSGKTIVEEALVKNKGSNEILKY